MTDLEKTLRDLLLEVADFYEEWVAKVYELFDDEGLFEE